MKLTKSYIRQLIKEELDNQIDPNSVQDGDFVFAEWKVELAGTTKDNKRARISPPLGGKGWLQKDLNDWQLPTEQQTSSGFTEVQYKISASETSKIRVIKQEPNSGDAYKKAIQYNAEIVNINFSV